MFALSLDAAVSAPRSVEARLSGASITIYIDGDAAAQVPTEGGPNHSSINHVVGILRLHAGRNSLNIWLERASFGRNPAHVRAIVSSEWILLPLPEIGESFLSLLSKFARSGQTP